MKELRALVKFVRDGHLVQCNNPDIGVMVKPSVGDLMFLNVKVDGKEIQLKNDDLSDGYSLKPFKVCQVIIVSHIGFGDLKSYDLIINLSTEYLDIYSLTEELREKSLNKKYIYSQNK